MADAALNRGVKGPRELAPKLLTWISDSRTMRLAWDHIAEHGGPSPGPSGKRVTDYTSAAAWQCCHVLAAAVRRGNYRPGKERVR